LRPELSGWGACTLAAAASEASGKKKNLRHSGVKLAKNFLSQVFARQTRYKGKNIRYSKSERSER